MWFCKKDIRYYLRIKNITCQGSTMIQNKCLWEKGLTDMLISPHLFLTFQESRTNVITSFGHSEFVHEMVIMCCSDFKHLQGVRETVEISSGWSGSQIYENVWVPRPIILVLQAYLPTVQGVESLILQFYERIMVLRHNYKDILSMLLTSHTITISQLLLLVSVWQT